MTQDPAQPDLGVLLALAYQAFVLDLHAALADAGFDDLGSSDGFVFRTLAEAPLTVSELAGRLAISKQGAGQVVADMERRGYVVRRRHPTDARARLVALSDRGLAALAAARAFHRRREAALVAELGERAVRSLRTGLTDLSGGETAAGAPRLRAGGL